MITATSSFTNTIILDGLSVTLLIIRDEGTGGEDGWSFFLAAEV